MPAFAQILKDYRSGSLTREQLLSAVDRQLAERQLDADALLELLNQQQASDPLPADVHTAFMRRITRAQDHTLIRHLDADAPATVVLNRPADDSSDGLDEVASQNRSPPVSVGSILQGRFRLKELVGEGGMSRVYKAIDLRRVEARSQDPYLAVKVLTVPFSGYFDSLAALQREAHKLQSLTHPNIVRVIDCDRDGQTVFMTMEFLSGESLHRKLQQNRNGLEIEAANRVVLSIAQALDFAHRTRIVHGDLKPGNVIIADSGDVKVIDFGIARFLARPRDSDAGERQDEWEVLDALTPPYASPEMFEDRVPDPRDDVYALACIAYETLTGFHPFARHAATVARDTRLKPIRHDKINGRQFHAIVNGLQFDRSKRTPTAQQFMDEFSGTRRATHARIAAIAAAAVLGLGTFWYVAQRPEVRQAVEPATAFAPGAVFRDCPTCPLMRVVPAGQYRQGSMRDASEQPEREVTIARPFAVALHEVTIGEFEEFAESIPRDMSGCSVYEGDWRLRNDANWQTVADGLTALHPVSCVSWEDAQAYVHWLARKTGQPYRLPSASEWEYAARAGTAALVPWQTEVEACSLANIADQAAQQRFAGWDTVACNDNHATAAPVGSFSANAFGLQDMLGNVFEWVADCWTDSYDGVPTDGSAHMSDPCTEHELRGGSWFTSPHYLRSSYRNRFSTGYRSTSVGFRAVRDITNEH